MRTTPYRVFLVTLAVFAGACASSDPQGKANDDWDVKVKLAPCGFSAPAEARIEVAESYDIFHDGAFARIEAHVASAAPISIYKVTQSEGACRYLEPDDRFCDPACDSGQICGADSECVESPQGINAGALAIKGLGDPIEIESASFAAGKYVGPSGLPGNLFGAADPIGARFSGDVFPAITLGAEGVKSVDPKLTNDGFEMLNGADAELTWAPGPDPEACIGVFLNGFNVAHGAPLQDVIWCEGEDTGSLRVPQALVERFPIGETPPVSEGFDWPHSEFSRYTRSRAKTDEGTAELVVRTTAFFRLSHPE